MVDPNRKINRLTEKDIEFLDECQEEFANRFTDEDVDFYNHCLQTPPDPPIVENWGFSGASNSHRGGSGQRNNYGGGNRYNRGGWNKRRRDHGNDGGYRSAAGQSYRHKRFNDNTCDRNFRVDNSREERPHQPMNVRRDYGNFVPASKD